MVKLNFLSHKILHEIKILLIDDLTFEVGTPWL